jgi:hypothetical protein
MEKIGLRETRVCQGKRTEILAKKRWDASPDSAAVFQEKKEKV